MTKDKKEHILPRILVNVALIIVVILLIYWRNAIAGKEYFYISYAPFSASVRIGDKYYKNNAYNYIEPGEYDLIVELEHFATITEHISVPNEFNSAYGALEAIDDEGDRIANAAAKEYQEVGKGAASESSPELGYEVEQYLPIQNSLYKIGSSLETKEDNSLTYSINIETDDAYIDSAIKKLFSFIDKDPAISAYDINLINYENPFSKPRKASFNENAAEYVKDAYNPVISSGEYEVSDEVVKSGRYVAVIMCTQKDTGGSLYKSSRVVLKRDGESWEILNTPYPLLTQKALPELPTTFLNRANLASCGV